MNGLRSGYIYITWLVSVLLLIPSHIFSALVFSQQLHSKFVFGKLNVENGLSSNVVNAILQDKSGLLWFGTENGLDRFDGYEFKVYQKEPSDTNSISDNGIWSLFEDRKGQIWVGTKNGELNCYNPSTENFKRIKLPPVKIKGNSITCIYEDSKNNVWIGTYKEGLYRFSSEGKRFEHWHNQINNSNSLSNNYVTSVCEDNSGRILIGTYNGLNVFKPDSHQKPFERFYSIQDNEQTISNNLIWSITKSNFNNNIIWICTLNGLTKYNSQSNSLSRFKLPVDTKLRLGNSISSIIEDSIGGDRIIWIGTYGGLLRINMSSELSERFSDEIKNEDGIVSNQINFLYKDRSDVVWIGTNNGINFFSHKRVKFNYLFQYSKNVHGIDAMFNRNIEAIAQPGGGTVWLGTNNGLYYLKNGGQSSVRRFNKTAAMHIWSLARGAGSKLWISTYGDGLKMLDLKSGIIKPVNIKNSAQTISAYNYVKSILQDRNGILWMGFWGTGLARMNTATGEIKYFVNEPENPASISYNDVWTIFEDSEGRIWIGTWGGGLNLFNETGNNFIRFEADSLISNNINCISESPGSLNGQDNKTILWIGTRDGLDKFVIKNNGGTNKYSNLKPEITHYTVNDGLSDNNIESIVRDKDGNLWIGTGAGLSFLNIRQNKFTNFSQADGLNGNIFNQNSACCTENGLLFFGSTSGLNIFNPEDINQSAYSPPVIITGFEIFNQPVKAGENSPLKTNIIGAKEVYPAFEQNVFSFKFSALDFNSPGSIRYAYKMEGFDKDWNYSGSRRYVTYTNLYPGTYAFKVKATNSDGIWNNRYTSLRVIIKSPWWRTEWAYVIYVSLIVLGLLAIRRFEKNRMQLRKELKMHEFEAKKQKEIGNLKSRFFANLSHEFRTPLMLIKGPLERIAFKSPDAGNDENYKMIYRNTEKLQNLIDQLLELTQLEAASIPLKAKQENLISLLRGFTASFETLTGLKGVELSLRLPDENINAWIDRDKFEKIINNLLSNAFKFTPAGGTITVQAEKKQYKENDFAEIKISDTGIGIPADKINKIFDRFYQVDDSSRKAYGGSGIGLSLVKELIELHKWNISVNSREYSGTEFIIRIPLSGSYLSDNEKTGSVEQNPEENNLIKKNFHGQELNTTESEDVSIQGIPKTNNGKSTILIVEDSEDVRIYLSDILKHDYNILQSKNCDEGISAASENSIDLIISDIMMPGRNGIEFCREIKTNWETSHIPLILLTAKASKESKLEGLETGADDYLTKPFDSKELIVRIKNLLEQRKLLRERFSREINFKPDTSKISNLDNEFIRNALRIAEINLDNPDFDSESFAQEMFVSRSQLHRKLTALTGQAPGEFLRIVRLKKAAQLLAEKNLSITQIAFAVGFNSPSHFSKAFQQQFNCLPSEFARKLA